MSANVRFDGKHVSFNFNGGYAFLSAKEARDFRAELTAAITQADINEPLIALRDSLRGRVLARAQSAGGSWSGC